MEQYKLFNDEQLVEFSRKKQPKRYRNYSPTNQENTQQKKTKKKAKPNLCLIKNPKSVLEYYLKVGVTDIYFSDFKKQFFIWEKNKDIEEWIGKNLALNHIDVYYKKVGLTGNVSVIKILCKWDAENKTITI